MMSTEMPGPVSMADLIIGVRHGLAFDARGNPRSIKKQTSKCRRILERIPRPPAIGPAVMVP